MNSGTIDLIATDPPFNKGRDFHATPESLASGATFEDRWSWEDDIHEEWIDTIKDDRPAVWEVIDAAKATYGLDMAAFLCFMGVRIMEMHRVLKDTGSIYLHCDPTASHHIKLMLDAVFGRKQFRNEIVWCYRGGGVPRTAFARKHDLILFYSKTSNSYFNRQYVSYSEASTKLVSSRGGVSIDGKERDLKRGAAMPDWWIDINSLQTWTPERTGYPTQKPLALYERIISASSNEGDMVLDPFCGCATTLVAAERLGRQWVGIDIWEKAHHTVLDRLYGEGLVEKEANRKGQGQLGEKDIACEKVVPIRTDEGEEAAPRLPTVRRVDEPGRRMSRAEMLEILISRHGRKCAGCDRVFDDPDYLDLDHNTPKADGGINHISNRILLCGPCNRRKSHKLTLSGLRE